MYEKEEVTNAMSSGNLFPSPPFHPMYTDKLKHRTIDLLSLGGELFIWINTKKCREKYYKGTERE